MHIIAVHSSDSVEIVHSLPPELQKQIQFVIIDPFILTGEEIQELNENNEPVLELPAFDEDFDGTLFVDVSDIVPKQLNIDNNIIYSEEYINMLTSELLKYSDDSQENKES